tara:strand:+ start:651 stop:2279 length:1629 start_codon:yes stop_codon:yes gene_type:complete
MWDAKRVCPECFRTNALRYLKEEEKRERLDIKHMKRLLSNVREALGFQKADTESTFDGWEVCAAISANQSSGQTYNRFRCDELTELYEYCLSLKRDEGFYDTKLTQNNRMGIAMLIIIINKVFSREIIEEWPLWCLPQQTKLALENAGLMRVNEIKPSLLFDRMAEEIYNGNPTFDDMVNLCRVHYYKYTLKPKYAWMPSSHTLIYGEGHQLPESLSLNSLWELAEAFQRYFYEGELIFTYTDYKLQVTDNKGVRGLTLDDCRWWFFNYLCKDYSIQLNQDTFPYGATNDELQQVINLSMQDISAVTGHTKVQEKLHGNIRKRRGIRRMVQELWPDYEMDNNLWNRMLVSEKRMSDLLEKVFSHFGVDYQYNEAVYIPTRTGRVARYAHSKKMMRVDGISHQLNLIVEGQGDYHYIDKTNVRSEWFDGRTWGHYIPDSYTGKATTWLEYRQEQDAKCRRAIKRHGFSPVYVVLSRFGRPVERVHGDIPTWNRKYVTGIRDTKSIGLAETFDMQGRKDIGDMIRDYYYNVVKMTKEMKRKLEE